MTNKYIHTTSISKICFLSSRNFFLSLTKIPTESRSSICTTKIKNICPRPDTVEISQAQNRNT